jgi:hypothetical protein
MASGAAAMETAPEAPAQEPCLCVAGTYDGGIVGWNVEEDAMKMVSARIGPHEAKGSPEASPPPPAALKCLIQIMIQPV